MMSKQRANLGFGDALSDLSDFAPTPKAAPKDMATGQAAEASGFVSREAKAPAQPKSQRRRRTGRNAAYSKINRRRVHITVGTASIKRRMQV
ncbi:hypothetical protein [Paracoccus jiaweipingae]|uniref:hypothetical protein n=1 Tax=unclassified Paracoccus (in: a-proteobacteria) TaxID=2688777 RepID=UPI0037B7C121